MNTKTLISGIALTLSLGLNTVWAGATDPEASETAKNAEATAPESAAPPETAKYNFTEGMNIPVDGSSAANFDKSLAEIKTKVTDSEYRALRGAIDYLLMYDLSSRRDRAKLAQHLDGMTGTQIVDTVQKRKARRR